MTIFNIPTFAVLGHPNEGKSSVVSTLSEDDSIRVGPVPGETLVCQELPVKIDGEEIIRFIDTPGFQSPRRTLAWMKAYGGPEEALLEAFIQAHKDDPDFRDECELLGPVARGAGIIYVVDGSRPLRNDDRAEMEILRMTGRPRMSVINCKEEVFTYLDQWKLEFRKHFNSIRVFNAHKATYQERIDLLESLKGVDQDWQPALSRVIEAFKQDWSRRTSLSAAIITEMLGKALSLQLTADIKEGTPSAKIREKLARDFQERMEKIERKAHQRIRKLYKHNIFQCELPPGVVLDETLFSEKTWRFLGLKPKEVALAAGVAGGAAGAAIDIAAAGLTFGIFSAIGGIAAAGSALISGHRLAGWKVKGIALGRDQISMGPVKNPQLMFVLADRALLYHSQVINWAHGRRDDPPSWNGTGKMGVTPGWSREDKALCRRFFKGAVSGKTLLKGDGEKELLDLITRQLSKSAA